MQPTVRAAPRHQILEALSVADAVRLQGKRFRRVFVGGSEAACQQRDRLGERSLARIIGPNEDRQGSEFDLGALRITLVAFETEPAEFHIKMIPVYKTADGTQRETGAPSSRVSQTVKAAPVANRAAASAGVPNSHW